MKMPKVSVVTGFYNRAPVLERTIESILKQTYRDFELIVFDDNSTDDTAELLAELSDRYQDSRFRYVIHEQNQGFVRGLSNAIAATTGEYIAIQGSGDASLPKRLELQVALLDSRPEVGAVGGWYYNIQEDQGTRRLRMPNADPMTFDDLLSANAFSHGEVMIRRKVFNQVGGYRTAFKYAQDRDLWFRIAKVARLATVPELIYNRYTLFDGVSYVPAKRVSQACYATAALRLAQMTPKDEAQALAMVESSGPTTVVDSDEPTVQKSLVHSAFRMVLFGSPASGIELARQHITSRMKRYAIIAIGKWFTSSLSAPLRPFVWWTVGIKRQ